ncbi:hypothetical protein ACFL35_00080 [Candidatus Riflebacteria bacterium]
MPPVHVSKEPEFVNDYWLKFRNACLFLCILNFSAIYYYSAKIFSLEGDMKNDEFLARQMMTSSKLLHKALGGFPPLFFSSNLKPKKKVIKGDPANEYSRLEYEISGENKRSGRCIFLFHAYAGVWEPLHFRFYSKDGEVVLFSKDLLEEYKKDVP